MTTTDPAERLNAIVLYELRHEDFCDYPIDGRCVCGPGQHLIDALADAYQRGQMNERERWMSVCRKIVSYADLTHRVVVHGGDPAVIADEWRGLVEDARRAILDAQADR